MAAGGGGSAVPEEESKTRDTLGRTEATTAKHGTSKHGPRVEHARKTVIKNGEIFAVPYKTSAKPFKREYPTSLAFGAVDPVLNPPKLFTKSAAASSHSAKKAMTAGTVRKAPEPYHPNAARNRLKTEFKRMPPPYKSTLKLGYGVPAVGGNRDPYTTTNRFSQKHARKPAHARTGFTNPGITAELARRAHTGTFS